MVYRVVKIVGCDAKDVYVPFFFDADVIYLWIYMCMDILRCIFCVLVKTRRRLEYQFNFLQ